MSRVSQDPEVLDQLAALLLDRGLAAIRLLAAPASQTSGAIVVTYTTGDPAVTGDGLRTVADGNTVTIAENYQGYEECLDQEANMVLDMTAIRTALDSVIANGAANASAPAALLSRLNTLVTTYSANDPAYTIDAAVTIAAGGTVDDEEIDDVIANVAAELTLARADISRLHAAVTTLINDGVKDAPVLAARTSTNGGVAITYTGGDPSYTPDGSFTVADGALMTAVNSTSFFEELINDLDFLGDDFTTMKTAYDLYLDAAGRPTS